MPIAKKLLSGSAQGRAVKVAATASPGTVIHTTDASDAVIDEVTLYAHNTSGTAVNLTVQFGGTTSPDDDIKLSVPASSGLTFVVPGLPLTGTGSDGNVVRAFAGTANVVTVSGYVNRIS